MLVGAVLEQQYNNCKQADIRPRMIEEAALFELLSLECRVDSDGALRYYNAHGQLHRVHGPAFEHPDGYRAWYQNGQCHRLDGPAVEYSKGGKFWYINGRVLSEAEWQQQVASMGNV